MFPDTNTQTPGKTPQVPYKQLVNEFVAEVKSQFSSLTGEIAMRNGQIQENDAYIYGDLIERRLNIPAGHDFTPVNWLRRTVEIHRTQFMGQGFTATTTYTPDDPQTVEGDDQATTQMEIENDKKKAYSESRRKILHGVFSDNGGDAFWAQAAENASAIGDTVVKGWYDEAKGKYILQQVEAVEHIYALWSRDDYRKHDAIAFIQQLSKQNAIKDYGVPDDVSTSPLGFPLVVLSTANIQNYISTQQMVTLMEVTGYLQGWCSYNGVIKRCNIGDETKINVTIVGNEIYQLIDDPKKVPYYYIYPNKRERRRPWGRSDITKAAININVTYIEALSDWRTVSSKVNFPKWKAFGFAPGVQFPKPKPRTVEMLPLVQGQDLQPLEQPNSAALGEQDFLHQMNELQNQFIREVGISRNLFDMPDGPSNSAQAELTAMKSTSDLTDAKRQLWTPILEEMCTDILNTLALHDDNINEVVTGDKDWVVQIAWPPMMNKDDPTYHAMQINMFHAGLLSVETLLENMGYDKQELDRIRNEMEDKVTAAIHGNLLGEIASLMLINPQSMAPKVNVNLRGDLSPEDVGNITYERGLDSGPFPATVGPQGNPGLTATDNSMNQGLTTGGKPGAMAVQKGVGGGQPDVSAGNAAATQASQNSGAAAQLTTQSQNQPGTQPISQPGSGAPAVTPQGAINQKNQRRGK